MRVKKLTHQPRKQARQSSPDRSRLGGHPYKRYILQRALPQTGIPQRQEAGIVGKSVYFVLKTNVSYKELGADYVRKQREEKRKTYLKKEMEVLGYEVDLKKVV